MQPHYTLFIDMCLTKPIEKDNIWVRLVKTIPFVPRKGDVIRIAAEVEGVAPLDIELENVVYDCADGVFLEEQEDQSMCESYRTEGVVNGVEAVGKYTQYGFIRLNFPTYEAWQRGT